SEEPGPSGASQRAPSTARHQGVPGGFRLARRSSLPSSAPNTNDQPNSSASVTYPVSATNAANSAPVTQAASIRKAGTSTVRTGDSPSPGLRSASSVPIRKGPASTSTVSSPR